jgi:hypothetical protein
VRSQRTDVKLNAATILREEQLYRDQLDREAKRLEELERGAFDEEAFRQEEQDAMLREQAER